MEEKIIDISKVENDEMKPYHLVQGIYEIHNYYAENEDKILDILTMNEPILDIIDDINFMYIKDGLEPTVVKKRVGYLLNLVVFLDPEHDENSITFSDDDGENVKVRIIL